MSTKRAADFLERAQRSGLVAAEKLAQSLEALATRDVDVDNPKAIADALVENETLTRWQADNLLQGKHKGFFVGSYRLLKPLGKGGMGTVYLAQHELMRRRCAVKVLPQTQLHEGSSMLERFYVEAQAVAAMDHQNIVRAYDVNKECKDNKIIHYLVMEYVDGQDIESMIQNSGPLDFVTAADYLRQTANGLAHAHESGLVHRDIKPANLLVDRKGVVKILDLGLARFFDDSGQASLTAAHNETVLGTADYLSPEQALDSHKVDHRTDLYSLGCTGYCMLTGHPPFNEGSVAQRLVAHQIRTPVPITQERRDTPRDLAAIIDKMMAKNVAERHENANAVSTALAAWLLEHGGEEWRRQHAEIASDVLSSLKHREPTRVMSSPTSETELELAPLDDDLVPSSGSGSRDAKAGRQGLPDGQPGAEAGKSRVGLPQVGGKPGTESGKSRVGLPQVGGKPGTESGKSRVGLPQVGGRPGAEAGSRGEGTVEKVKSAPPTARGKTLASPPTENGLDPLQAADPLGELASLDSLGTLDGVDLMGATDHAASLASVADDWLQTPISSSVLASPARRPEPPKGLVASIGLPILIGGAGALLLVVIFVLVIVLTRSGGSPSTSQQMVSPPAGSQTQPPLPAPELTQAPKPSGEAPGTSPPKRPETSGPAATPIAPPPAVLPGQAADKRTETLPPDSPFPGSPTSPVPKPVAPPKLDANPQPQSQPKSEQTQPPPSPLPVAEASENQIRELLAGMREIAIEFKADEKIHEMVSKMVEAKIKESVATLGLKVSRNSTTVMRVNLTGKQEKDIVVFRLSAEVECPADSTTIKVWSNDKELGKFPTQGMAPDVVLKSLRSEVSDFVAAFLRDYRKAVGAKRG